MWQWIVNRRVVVGCVLGGFAIVAWFGLSGGPSAEVLAEGRELFEHVWTENDPLAGDGDGLGPVFNERSCVACHFQGGVGGGGSNQFNVNTFEAQPSRQEPDRVAGVIHASATKPAFLETKGTVRERHPIQRGRTVDDGHCSYREPDFDPLRFESINTPPLFGLGLVDEISDWSIRSGSVSSTFGQIGRELQGDFAGTPAGRPRAADGGFGKFGWKGQFATLEDFVATACAVELGLSNPVRKQDLPHASREDENAALDMDRSQLRALVAFVRSLPRPEQILPSDPAERARAEHGEVVFEEVGCANCHPATLGGIDGFYSDLLLHRIENPETDDYGLPIEGESPPDGGPIPSEWKTPPLWGVADSAPYFHDGESPTLEAAIARHGGHARGVLDRYLGRSPADREAVVAFLRTLRAPVSAIPVAAGGSVAKAK